MEKNDVHKVATELVVAFFKEIMPFKELDNEALLEISRHVRVDFFPKGTRIFTAGETEITHLYLIQKGGVKAFITDDEGEVTLKDYRGEGAYIGALPIIRGTRANLNIETVEDTFLFMLPREDFISLIEKQPGFAQYYLKSFSEKIVTTAYSELRRHKVGSRADEDLYLFSIQVGDLAKSKPKHAPTGTSVQDAARIMAEHRISSVLIHSLNDPDDIIGIITDRDLRNKVIAAGLDYTEPVEKIMSSPVSTVLSHAVCFDALIKMMSTGLHHLAVERKGKIIGVITSHDIMLLQGNSPYLLFKEIRKQENIQGLYLLSHKIPDLIRSLIKEGGKASNISRMISLLNDQILARLLTLLEEELGPPPVPYCWLVMGSEGRKEQTFKTDQDNGLIYADPKNETEQKKAEEYFEIFAGKAIDHLVNCGYPLCPGNIMASNPALRLPLSGWKDTFHHLVNVPQPDELLRAAIYFDFRDGFGQPELASELHRYLHELTRAQQIYLLHMARECLSSRAPLSFFKNFIVEKDGEHKNKLDIKKSGLMPFVGFARVMALKYGIKETNTMARLHVLAQEGHISEQLWHDAGEAYEIQMYLRLLHQLEQMEAGIIPDNYIDPKQLSDLEKRMLKEAFLVIERLHNILKTIFPLG